MSSSPADRLQDKLVDDHVKAGAWGKSVQVGQPEDHRSASQAPGSVKNVREATFVPAFKDCGVERGRSVTGRLSGERP